MSFIVLRKGTFLKPFRDARTKRNVFPPKQPELYRIEAFDVNIEQR
jgi:hypothetical protein